MPDCWEVRGPEFNPMPGLVGADLMVQRPARRHGVQSSIPFPPLVGADSVARRIAGVLEGMGSRVQSTSYNG